MNVQIDWKSIRPFKGSQNKGFEQLCFQLAYRTHHKQGNFTEIDDTGGGDGVEFYQERASGREWGWQAKFYDQSGRLSLSGRKQKIIQSLKIALKCHPKLDKWILCTNSQFTSSEQKWFKQVLTRYIPSKRKVILEHWSEGKIQFLIDKPENCGIKNAFFGSLQLSKEWFQSKFDKVKHLVSEKYMQDLHTKDHELYYYYLGPLLLNADFFDRCERNYGRIEAVFDEYKESLGKINYKVLPSGVIWPAQDKYLKVCKKTEDLIKQTLAELKKILGSISANGIELAYTYRAEYFSKPISELREELFQLYRNQGPEFQKDYVPASEDEKHRLISLKNNVSDGYYKLEKINQEIFYYIRDISIPKRDHLHLLGGAGIGKTHICTSIADQYLQKDVPVIFIPGVRFRDHDSIETQILELLDIRSNYSFDEFLETLNILGRMNNVRVPIIIDGLNESVNDKGLLNSRWKQDIGGLEQQIGKLSNVVLLTTCRTSYQNEIWKNSENSHLYRYNGFSYEEDRKKLVKVYFSWYGINGDLTYLSFSHFSNPLFLKIFCQTKYQPNQQVYVQLGSDSIYDIFGQFIKKCDATVSDRLQGYGLAPTIDNRTVASRLSIVIGKSLWEKKARSLDFTSYVGLYPSFQVQIYSSSPAKALIDEGLLLVRDWTGQGEHVGFTYDLIGGYCIANYLFYKHHKNIKKFVTSRDFISGLVSNNYKTRHPLAEDILQCFIALCPAKTGKHLLHILPREKRYSSLCDDSFLAFFKISGKYIEKKEITITKKIFAKCKSPQRQNLLERASEIFFVPDHPLNFYFFSEQLFSLSLTEKDLCWCEFLRDRDEGYLKNIISEFESINSERKSFNLKEQKQKNDIVAEFLAWSLGSNLISYRKDATRALYLYGRSLPDQFITLAAKFIHADDIYIRERLMAIAFGLVSAACKDGGKREFVLKMVDWTYRSFFTPKAQYANTHVLMRDYASQLIEAGCFYFPELKNRVNLSLVKGPYTTGGIRRWGTAVDKNKTDYRDGNSLIDFFFDKDKLIRLTKGDYYKKSKENDLVRSQIVWRAYKLGYLFKDFETIDQQIAKWNGYSRGEKKTEKYGEKYTWIAYFELAGYMLDKGLIMKPYKSNYPIREFGEDFDPTFPNPKQELRFFEKDLIGSRKNQIKKWLNSSHIPDVTELLVVNILTLEKESFVLLDAFKCQTDENAERQVFFWLTAIMATEKNLKPAMKAAVTKNVAGEVQSDFHETVYAGEYPYSDYFPEMAKKTIQWPFKKVKVKRKYAKEAIFKNNKIISERLQMKFWKEMQEKFSYYVTSGRGFMRVYTDFKGKEVGPIHMNIGTSKTPPNLGALIKNEADKKGYEIRVITKFFNETEEINQEVKILMPILGSPIGKVIAKEIAKVLKLDSRGGTTDLFDMTGKRASISFRLGDKYNNNHSFIYLRKDLLDTYLKQRKLKLFWSFEGEWNHWVKDGFSNRKLNPHWKKFSKTIEYSGNSNL